jgi:hypothetical protein
VKRTVEAEQYFTSPQVVEECLNLIEKHFSIASFDLHLEPSAGGGAFLLRLPEATRVGLDIFPLHQEIQQQDFLTWLPKHASCNVLTIGNPPFGQRANLAVKFLEHAALFSNVIAFVLPRSFRKYTFLNRVPEFFHLVDSFDCDDFQRPDGETVTVKSVFQIWQKRPIARNKLVPQGTHNHFDMKHAHLSRTSQEDFASLCESYDFAIPQVGAAFRPKNPNTLTQGSYWFIKSKAPGVREAFEQLDFSFLDGMNTAHKSLSKTDIVAAYKKAIDDNYVIDIEIEPAITLF